MAYPDDPNILEAPQASTVSPKDQAQFLQRLNEQQQQRVPSATEFPDIGGRAVLQNVTGAPVPTDPMSQPYQEPGPTYGQRFLKQFAANLLGVGGQMLMAEQRQKMAYDAQEREISLRGIESVIMGGGAVTPDMLKAAKMDPKSAQFLNILGGLRRQQFAQDQQMMQQAGMFPGAGPGVGGPAAAPQAVPQPQAPSFLPPQTQQAMLPLGQPPGTAPGGATPMLASPTQAARSEYLPSAPAVSTAAAAPAPQARGVDLAQYAARLTGAGKTTFKGQLQLPSGGKMEFDRVVGDPALQAQAFLGQAQAQNASPLEASTAARAGGLVIPDAVHDQYGKDWAARNLGPTLERHMKTDGNPIDAVRGAYLELFSQGYLHPEFRSQIAATQRDVDSMYLSSIAKFAPGDWQSADKVLGVTLGPVSQAVRDQARAGARQSLMDALTQIPLRPGDPTSPPITANPAAMANALVRAGLGTAEDEKVATSYAPIGTEAEQVLARANELRPLARGAGKGLPPGAVATGTGAMTGAQEAQRIAEQEKAAAEAQRTKAVTEAAVRGHEAVRPEMTIPPTQLHEYVDPEKLKAAPPGSKYGDVEGPNSKYVGFLGTPADLASLPRLREVLKTYHDNIKTLQPLLERGSIELAARKLGITGGGGMKIPWTDLQIGRIPAGALPDETALKLAFPDVKNQADRVRYAKAMISLQAASDTGLSILRSNVFNEKGNIRGDVINAGLQALPSLSDNWITSTQKYHELAKRVDAMERGFGLPGFTAPRLGP